MTARPQAPTGGTERGATETAEERSRRWIEELDAVERMTPDECRAELRRMTERGGFLGAVATAALIRDRRAV